MAAPTITAASTPKPEVAGEQYNIKGSEGTQEHLAFNAQVEHPATLSKGLANGSIQVRSSQADARRQDSDQDSGGKDI